MDTEKLTHNTSFSVEGTISCPHWPSNKPKEWKHRRKYLDKQQANDGAVITGKEMNDHIINWLHWLSLAQGETHSL